MEEKNVTAAEREAQEQAKQAQEQAAQAQAQAQKQAEDLQSNMKKQALKGMAIGVLTTLGAKLLSLLKNKLQ